MGVNRYSGGVSRDVYQINEVLGSVVVHNHGLAGSEREPVNQVPPAPLLRDRAHERAYLDGVFDMSRPGLSPRVVISGMRGIGSRSLARYMAHELAERFPYALLHVDYARPEGEGIADPAWALAHCLRSLGVDDAYHPQSATALQQRFREKCAGRRVLVVVENAASAAQVRMLFPDTAGCGLLATSVVHLGELTVNGVHLVRLQPLDPAAALELLADCLDRPDRILAEPDAADDVVARCAALPLAIRLAATRLALHPTMTLADLASELQDGHRRLQALDPGLGLNDTDPMAHDMVSVLDLAVRDLTADQAQVYHAVGLLPADCFTLGMMAAALAIDSVTADGLLDHLVRACLLEPTLDGRYQVHGLIRLHARHHVVSATPLDPVSVLTRVTDHVLAVTAHADHALRADRLRITDTAPLLAQGEYAFRKGPTVCGDCDDCQVCTDRRRLALAWLARERATILAVLREALAGGLYTQVRQLSEVATALFLEDRHVRDWLESLDLGLDAIAAERRAAPDDATLLATEARLRSVRSRPLLDLGREDDALRDLETALNLASQAGHLGLTASVHEFYGRYWKRHDTARAIQALTRARELNEQIPDARGAALAELFLGQVHQDAGDLDMASLLITKAMGEFQACKDRRMTARARAALGGLRAEQGELEPARQLLEQAAQELGDSTYAADARSTLGDVLLALGIEPNAARRQYEQALTIYQITGNPKAEQIQQRLADLPE